MSLVDYGSSDDDEQEQPQPAPASSSSTIPHSNQPLHHQPQPQPQPQSQQHQSSSSSMLLSQSSGNQQSQNVSPLLPPPFEKLPDVSLLLNSPISSAPVGTDHSARVAAAMADNASRKREANGSSSSSTRVKIPRSNLPQSKNIPETSSGLLTPPQLRGRSNVVTEDITKLFVRRNPKEKS